MALNPLDQLKKLVSLLFRVCVASLSCYSISGSEMKEHDKLEVLNHQAGLSQSFPSMISGPILVPESEAAPVTTWHSGDLTAEQVSGKPGSSESSPRTSNRMPIMP